MIANQNVCLMMMVKNESAIIERCLESVKDYVDHWLIADTGSTDDTVERIRMALEGIPGEVVEIDFTDFSAVRNQLLEQARGKAELLLWLDADETVEIVQPDVECPKHPVCDLGISTPEGVFMQPRLIRADARCIFTGEVGESLVGMDGSEVYEGMVLHHHQDGCRWRDAARNKRDILHLEKALLEAPRNPLLVLPYARALAAGGRLFEAVAQYRQFAELEADTGQRWFAGYQAARLLDRMDCSSAVVIDAYYDAFDVDVDRVEPLVHMARKLRLEGRLDAALDIVLTALELETVKKAGFYEPNAWAEDRILEYLKINLALNRFSQVIMAADYQLSQGCHRPEIIREITGLRDQAREQQAENPQLENHPGPAVATPAAPKRPQRPQHEPSPIPDATPRRRERRKLCIGMAHFEDYDGAYFSIQAIRMFHPEILDEIEFVIIDNSPTHPAGQALKKLEKAMDNFRYVPQTEAVGTITKDYIFREAHSDYVMVMDCHVFVAPGALRRLIDWFDAHPDTPDLVQGPLVYDDLKSLSTHFEPGWRGGMYGKWKLDPRGEDPEGDAFDIPMQGCGLFACRKDAWQGFNPRFRGFGAEEGYIHEKFRQAGGRTLCFPYLRWMHRFNRPMGIPYPIEWEGRIRNYVIGWTELGLDVNSIREHFTELLNEADVTRIYDRIERELASPLHGYDTIVYLADDADSAQQLESLAVAERVVKLEVSPSDALPRFAETLRELLESTSSHCLVVQDLAALDNGQSRKAGDLLAQMEAGDVDQAVLAESLEPGLETNLVLHSRAFSRIAEALPQEQGDVSAWLNRQGGLSQFIGSIGS